MSADGLLQCDGVLRGLVDADETRDLALDGVGRDAVARVVHEFQVVSIIQDY